MGAAGEPNFYGRQLIRGLKALREQAEFGQDEAGALLHMTLQKVSRIENGQLPGWHELRGMLTAYRLPSDKWSPYLELWDLAKHRGWWLKYRVADSRYLRMEHTASTVYEFQIGYLPELLQTEQYTRAMFTHDTTSQSAKAVEREVEARQIRQQRLLSSSPLRLHTIVHEPVLYQGVDRAQLIYLLRQAELPNVTLQVLPQACGLHPGLYGGLKLLSFDDRKLPMIEKEPDIVFSWSVLGWSDTQDVDQVAKVRCILDGLAERALSAEESMEVLKTLEGGGRLWPAVDRD
jgi:transcriptional regulator with XRE-family HTH domain